MEKKNHLPRILHPGKVPFGNRGNTVKLKSDN